MAKRDYYEVLMVSKTSTDVEIKKSYRNLAKQYHPDLNPGNTEAEEKFKECSEAYGVLSDPQKRAVYDQYGHRGLENQGFGGFDAQDIFSNFGDIFDSFFGFGGGQRQKRGKGADLQMGVHISFKEAVFGCKKEIDLKTKKSCTDCKGTGADKEHPPVRCETCNGYGQVQQNRGFISMATTCPKCRGAGQTITHACKSCKGKGQVLDERKIEVEIPAGVDTGNQLRLEGKGQMGPQSAGDLFIVIEVDTPKHIIRQEEHVLIKKEIGIAAAALGTKITIETLEGEEEEIDIPRGIQSGERVVLEGKGIPHIRRKGRGNFYIEITVKTPQRLTKKQEELLKAFAQESGEAVKSKKKFFSF